MSIAILKNTKTSLQLQSLVKFEFSFFPQYVILVLESGKNLECQSDVIV